VVIPVGAIAHRASTAPGPRTSTIGRACSSVLFLYSIGLLLQLYEAVGVLRFRILIDASKVTTPPYYNTSIRLWVLKLGGRLLLHPWAVPVASYWALGPSGARK
jgi:hypothetical protein